MILLLAQLDLAHRHSLNPGATAQRLRAHQGCSSRPRTVRHGARPYHPDVQEEAAAAAETLSGMGAVSGYSLGLPMLAKLTFACVFVSLFLQSIIDGMYKSMK